MTPSRASGSLRHSGMLRRRRVACPGGFLMVKRLIALPVALAVLLLPGLRQSPRAAEETLLPLLKSMERQDICLMPPSAPAYQATRGARQPGQDEGGPLPPGWPGKNALGGNVPPARVVADPHPTFDGMAIDPQNDIVVLQRREPQQRPDLRPHGRRPLEGDDRRRATRSSARRRTSASSPASRSIPAPRVLHRQQRRRRPGRASPTTPTATSRRCAR